MTDPLSISSGAAGAVSLGIQICQGLVKYYKDWNSREEDVEVAVTSLEREQNILILLQRSLKMENHSALLIDDIAEVEKCIVNIQRAFSCLDTILQKCRHYPAPGSMKERAKTIGVVALYPFRKDTLKEIQHRVGDIGIVLAKAVQILQLDLTQELMQDLSLLSDLTQELKQDQSLL
ncbi:hypothetical protein EV356DRAFT_536036 [Viridothelium virens]|uniref:Fungal N-terminal domain-containing protein n=1 Tax=Viridothelium virens TaxID=1048519 RepID=A0A6A6GZ20_VIRVR|nr:hypothetical protein EV356DRAFT_536036 [Viridothelium virens]